MLLLVTGSLMSASAQHLIPEDSDHYWDYRGEVEADNIKGETHDALYECKSYEELITALDVAIKELERQGKSDVRTMITRTYILASLRAHYIIGETDKADDLMETYEDMWYQEITKE